MFFNLTCPPAAFVWEDGAYRARTFNFYIFPRPFEGHDKRFVCQVGGWGVGRRGRLAGWQSIWQALRE
jgi:hypothetical protein